MKSYGSDGLLKAATFKRKSSVPLTIGLWDEQNSWGTNETRYMYEVTTKKAFCLNNLTNMLGHSLKNKYGLDQINSFARQTSVGGFDLHFTIFHSWLYFCFN